MDSPVSPARRRPFDMQSAAFVLSAGLLTTAAALFGVWYVGQEKNGENVMGWYVDYVIPAGALLVGIVAGSGYGLCSWGTGTRINRTILICVLVLQFLAYWTAQYLAFEVQHLVYRSTGEPIGFFHYFHLTTINMVWKSSEGNSNADPQPLGMWGWGLRILEIIGFVGGALIILVMLSTKPYCETCRRYMKSRKLPTLPASIKLRSIKKSDSEAQAAYTAEQQQAAQGGQLLLEQMASAAKAGDVSTFNNIVDAAKPSSTAAKKLPRRIQVELAYCDRCFSGHLAPSVVTGRGKRMKFTRLPKIPVPQPFVREAVGGTPDTGESLSQA